jgi:DNA-binding protein
MSTPVESQTTGNIIISSDGSVTGTTTIAQSGNTYTLTANITGKITVQKSNIVIDGAGYAINGAGIDFPTSTVREELIYNVTIRNLIISTGKYLQTAADTTHSTTITYIKSIYGARSTTTSPITQ